MLLMTSIYENFGPAVRGPLSYAGPERIKIYLLMDMDLLSAWTTGRPALLGDAGHPFLPFSSH